MRFAAAPLVFVLLFTGCAFNTPLPARCQEVGVAATDDDTITGTIVEEHVTDLETVRINCRDYFRQNVYGCTIAVSDGEYVIWRIDDPSVRDHEYCHVLYEEWRHVDR